MSAEQRRAQARARKIWDESAAAFRKILPQYTDQDVSVMFWSNSISDKLQEQWPIEARQRLGSFDWNNISVSHKGHREVTFAILCGDRLCGLGHFHISKTRILLRFIEGSPLEDCPLRPSRAAIILALVAIYGQRSGVEEMHLCPLNDTLADFYRNSFGFRDALDSQNQPFLKLSLK